MAIAVADSWGGTSGTRSTVVNVSGINAGDLLVVCTFAFSTTVGIGINVPLDNAGNTYTERVEAGPGSSATFRSWLAIADTIVTSPPTTVTAAAAEGASTSGAVVLRVTGHDASPFDIADSVQVTTDDPSAPSLTPSVADALIVTCLDQDGADVTFDAPSNYTMQQELESNANQAYAVATRVVSAIAANAPQWITGGSRDYSVGIAAYKAATAAAATGLAWITA